MDQENLKQEIKALNNFANDVPIEEHRARKLMEHTQPLKQLKGANYLRGKYGFKHEIKDWNPAEWACAVAGEVGELCNLVKKLNRGDEIDFEEIADEAADVLIYLDILCQRLGIDLTNALVNKFNKKSEEIGSDIKIYYY